jgi:hypothetical protein
MRISLTFDGDLRAEAYATATAFRNGVDAAMDKTGKQTLDYARVVMRSALGPKAANTVGRKNFIDADKPLQLGIYDRWWRGPARSGGTSPPEAFWLAATIRPRQANFLAVPAALNRMGNAGRRGGVAGPLAGVSYASGQIDTGAYVQGIGDARDSLGRFRGGDAWEGRRRMTPRVFERSTGLQLRYVPPTGGRRFALLVADVGSLNQFGKVRKNGKPAKKPRVTVVAFLLLPQTRVPPTLEWGTVIDYSGDQLAQNVATMVSAALEDGAPAFSVSAT